MTMRYAKHYGAFEVSSLPGQSQVAVCHSFFVNENQRGKGFAHKLKAKQLGVLQAKSYDYAICTVAASNAAQRAVLAEGGWQKLAEFRNHRSSETTELWGIEP